MGWSGFNIRHDNPWCCRCPRWGGMNASSTCIIKKVICLIMAPMPSNVKHYKVAIYSLTWQNLPTKQYCFLQHSGGWMWRCIYGSTRERNEMERDYVEIYLVIMMELYLITYYLLLCQVLSLHGDNCIICNSDDTAAGAHFTITGRLQHIHLNFHYAAASPSNNRYCSLLKPITSCVCLWFAFTRSRTTYILFFYSTHTN